MNFLRLNFVTRKYYKRSALSNFLSILRWVIGGGMLAHSNVLSLEKLTRKHRGDAAPVVATLLLVAIAVVGGTIFFTLSQGYFGQAQISGTPTIEIVKIVGYDARDVTEFYVHDGYFMPVGTAGDLATVGKFVDERIAVYIQNDSVNPVIFDEIRLAGTVYTYDTSGALGLWNDVTDLVPGEYSVLTDSTTILQEQAPIIQPGQTVTILIDLDDSFPIGRDTQFKLTTTNGAIWVETVFIGHNNFSFYGIF